jgi:hypothetical protein
MGNQTVLWKVYLDLASKKVTSSVFSLKTFIISGKLCLIRISAKDSGSGFGLTPHLRKFYICIILWLWSFMPSVLSPQVILGTRYQSNVIFGSLAPKFPYTTNPD